MRSFLSVFRSILILALLGLAYSHSLYAIDPPDLGPDTTVCGGITLDAGSGYASYQWSTAIVDTNQTVFIGYIQDQVLNLQIYVTVTDSLGDTASDTIQIIVNPLPFFDLGPDRDFCDIIILDGGNPGSLYDWCNGDLSQTSIVTPGNDITCCLKITNIYGCCWNDTLFLNYVDQPVIGFSSTADSARKTFDFVNSSTGENIKYVWDFGDGSPQANTRDATHTYQSSGYYQVCLTISNACDTLTQCQEIIVGFIDGLEDSFSESITLFPNPVSDQLFVEFFEFRKDVNLKLLNPLGHIFYQKYLSQIEQQSGFQIDISGLASGIYFILIEDDENRFIKKWIKQ